MNETQKKKKKKSISDLKPYLEVHVNQIDLILLCISIWIFVCLKVFYVQRSVQ